MVPSSNHLDGWFSVSPPYRLLWAPPESHTLVIILSIRNENFLLIHLSQLLEAKTSSCLSVHSHLSQHKSWYVAFAQQLIFELNSFVGLTLPMT
jgi:hypothetical protein